jgi:hypothetical protein
VDTEDGPVTASAVPVEKMELEMLANGSVSVLVLRTGRLVGYPGGYVRIEDGPVTAPALPVDKNELD